MFLAIAEIQGKLRGQGALVKTTFFGQEPAKVNYQDGSQQEKRLPGEIFLPNTGRVKIPISPL
jgi:hypothetical protein